MTSLRPILRERGFWAGVLFLSCGGFFIAFAQAYPIGTTAQMGAGYFPTAIGIMLAVIGLVRIAIATVRSEAVVEPIELRPLILIIGSVVLFGICVRPLGLILSTAMVVGLTSLATKNVHIGEVALLALGMIVVASVGFVYALGVALPLWPAF